MPFLIFDVKNSDGYRQYSFVKEVKIAGNKGPLAIIQAKRNTDKVSPFGWRAPYPDILKEIPGTDVNQEIIIDLKPNVANNVSLYKLLDVWGFSYEEWTPIAVRLQTIFSDRYEKDPIRFKRSFSDIEAERSELCEFLYLQGGVAKGTWSWGMVGRVNGALLWPDAYRFLNGELSKYII